MSSQSLPAKPEIMSPAGYWPQLRAAIEAGADSVYFGLKHFTARAKAGFALSELPEAMRTLHERGVKGYVTFNTLVFEHELHEAAEAIASIAEAGADAIIVQDAGIVKLARQVAPGLEIHGSTQMSITDAAGVRFAHELGVSRVTLARELSLSEVASIRRQTDVELEIFVHGALCVAYSGQCFSSEAWGGRSANRGQCAQACRLPYELVVDGQTEPLGDARYLLSPGDLYALHHVPEIVGMGIAALKIEGRYKDAAYVALATSAYRRAVDEAAGGKPLSVTSKDELALEQIYSRGLGPFFLEGTNHQKVVQGRAPRHRGVLMGRVERVGPADVAITPAAANRVAPLKPGDGVVFDSADWRSPEEPEEGGRVFEVFAKSGALELRFGRGGIDHSRIRPGDLLWRTDDPDVDRAVRPLLEPAVPVARQAVDVRVIAREGSPLRTRWSLHQHPGIVVEVDGEAPLGEAQNRPIDIELLRDQLGRLGGTAYELGRIDPEVEGRPFAPASMLNDVRRRAADALRDLQTRPRAVEVRRGIEIASTPVSRETDGRPRLHLLVRAPEQLDAALGAAPASITLDYLDLYGLKPSVERVISSGIAVRVASPRVLKPGEEKIAEFLLRLECPLLVRSTGLLLWLAGREHRELTGDFSLNAANSMTAAHYLGMGFERLTPTYDLNGEQVAALARDAGPGAVEVVAYSHLPVFHTEHCVFCRFLSEGTSYKDCGRPCDTHRVAVRDPGGRAHPVIADVGCRNTVFGAEAQDASAHLDAWLEAGIRHFRLEFVHETGDQVRRAARAFTAALNGDMGAQELAAELRRIAPQGTTQGSFFVPAGYQTLPVLQ